MAVFVLVHGGYPQDQDVDPDSEDNVYGSTNGGHVFRRVDRALTAMGHTVYRPTLSGYGSRIHLAGPQLALNTLVRDITGLIEYEDLYRVILLGFSFGGLVVSGVASRMPDRIHRLVYFDAFVPEDG